MIFENGRIKLSKAQSKNLVFITLGGTPKPNLKPHKDSTTGFKGVDFLRRQNAYRARITVKGKQRFIGLFRTPEAAHRAYQDAAIEYGLE